MTELELSLFERLESRLRDTLAVRYSSSSTPMRNVKLGDIACQVDYMAIYLASECVKVNRHDPTPFSELLDWALNLRICREWDIATVMEQFDPMFDRMLDDVKG